MSAPPWQPLSDRRYGDRHGSSRGTFNAAAMAQALEVIVERARQAKVALVLGTCFADADGARYDAPAILIMGEMGAPGEGPRRGVPGA